MVTGRSGVPRKGDLDIDGECSCETGAENTCGVCEYVFSCLVIVLVVVRGC